MLAKNLHLKSASKQRTVALFTGVDEQREEAHLADLLLTLAGKQRSGVPQQRLYLKICTLARMGHHQSTLRDWVT